MNAVIDEVAATATAPPREFADSVGVQWIPLDRLVESPWNPRQHYPEKALEELTESMRESGFREWLPLMVRPLPDDVSRKLDLVGKDLFEIGAGHRRSRAAREAGLTEVPCIVRQMSDEEFLDVLNFDNSGREDVHPLHEAAGWQAWMEKTGKGVIDIASRIGQSKEYVYQRLKYAALIPEARRVFLDGGLTAGHAVLIARVPRESDQKKALDYCKPRYDGMRPGVRSLADFIARDIHLELSGASFDIASETLVPEAGACATCPKRTGNSPALVIPELQASASKEDDDPDDFDDDEDPGGDDQCTDPACFSAKLDAHLVQIKEKLAAKGQAPIEVSGGWGKPAKGVLNHNAYSEVPKSPDAQVAIVKDGVDAGKVIYIKLLADERSAQAESRKKEDAQREAKSQRERAVRLKILEAIRAKTGARLVKWEIADLIEMALDNMSMLSGAHDLCRLRGIEVPDVNASTDPEAARRSRDSVATDVLIKSLPSLSEVEMFRLALELPVMDDFEQFALARNDAPKKLMALAKSYNIDAAKIRRDVEEALKEAEGGTRREVEKPKAATATKPKPAATKKAPASKAKPLPSAQHQAKKKAAAKQPAKSKVKAKKKK